MTDSIERELELPVDLDTLWCAVTDPATLRTWLADEIEWELQPGGAARFGWVEEVCAPQEGEARLAFWWQLDGEPGSRVLLELSQTARGTRLVVIENRPLEIIDVVGIPLGGADGRTHGPAMVCA
jgi:uncharacterized protein YndB with AHSA1/START domain